MATQLPQRLVSSSSRRITNSCSARRSSRSCLLPRMLLLLLLLTACALMMGKPAGTYRHSRSRLAALAMLKATASWVSRMAAGAHHLLAWAGLAACPLRSTTGMLARTRAWWISRCHLLPLATR